MFVNEYIVQLANDKLDGNLSRFDVLGIWFQISCTSCALLTLTVHGCTGARRHTMVGIAFRPPMVSSRSTTKKEEAMSRASFLRMNERRSDLL